LIDTTNKSKDKRINIKFTWKGNKNHECMLLHFAKKVLQYLRLNSFWEKAH
jgi:hypothetical protein